MNVDNPDLGLLLSHQLDNTDVVVITGNPEDGWTLDELGRHSGFRAAVTAHQVVRRRPRRRHCTADCAVPGRSGVGLRRRRRARESGPKRNRRRRGQGGRGFVPQGRQRHRRIAAISGLRLRRFRSRLPDTNAARSVHEIAPATTDSSRKPALRSVKNDDASTATDLRPRQVGSEPGDAVAAEHRLDDSDSGRGHRRGPRRPVTTTVRPTRTGFRAWAGSTPREVTEQDAKTFLATCTDSPQ